MDGSTNGAGIRAARNQALFRSINEQIEEIECMDRIVMSLQGYREIRRVPTHFFVKRGHVYPEFERVVEEHDGWVIVEKHAGLRRAGVRRRSAF
jgi:hypothetical protein